MDSYYQEWKTENLEHWKEYQKNYREKHRKERLEYLREYIASHREESRLNASKFYEKNRESILSRKKELQRALVQLLGGKCVRCNITERLEIDHVNAGGTSERKSFGNNSMMYKYYLDNQDEAKCRLQVLCKKHNREKQTLNKEFFKHNQ